MKPYTQLNRQDVEQVLQQFDLSPLVEFQALEGGAENSNFVLTTQLGQYVLTLCERKTFAETDALARLLMHLEQHQFSTTQVVLNKAQQYLSSFQHKPILLKSFLRGEVREELSNELLYKIGASIGRLHQVPAPDYLPNSYSYGIQSFRQLQEANIDHPFVDWLAEKEAYIKANMHPDLPKSLIHGDVFFSNVIVSDQGIPTIMDFEEACHYYRIYDLGMAVVGLCLEAGTITLVKAQQLLAGYQSEIRLESIEREQLKAFTVYAATATAFWRFRQFRLVVPNEKREDDYLSMKRVADQIFAMSPLALIPS